MNVHADVAPAAVDLARAVEFAWTEADLLDTRSYDDWLALWADDGHYVIPTDRDATDFAAVLNVAYDGREMLEARVKRLKSGYAMSAVGAARTVRTLSRFRLLSADAAGCELRCAQHLVEHKFGATRLLAADITYRLVVGGAGLMIDEKVVRLINADEALHGIGYLL